MNRASIIVNNLILETYYVLRSVMQILQIEAESGHENVKRFCYEKWLSFSTIELPGFFVGFADYRNLAVRR